MITLHINRPGVQSATSTV